MGSRYTEEDLSGLRRTSVEGRESKVHTRDFATPVGPGASVRDLVASFPRILAGDDFRAAVDALVEAARKGSNRLWLIACGFVIAGNLKSLHTLQLLLHSRGKAVLAQ